MNPKILYNNKLSDGTLTASATDADPIYNVAHLTDLRPHTLWKGTTADPLYIDVDLGTAIPFGIFGSSKLTNGEFETNPNVEWSTAACSIASAAGGYSGNCCQLTPSSGTSQYFTQTFTGLTPGKSYRVSVYHKNGTLTSQGVKCGVYDAGYLLKVQKAATTGAAWAELTFDFIAEGVVNQVAIFKTTATLGGTVLFDSCTLYEIGKVPMWNGLGIVGHNFETVKARVEIQGSMDGTTYHTMHEGYRKNLVSNGNFSIDATGWTGTACTVAKQSDGQANTGFQITRVSGTYQFASIPVTLVHGKSYRFSVYVKSGTSGNEAFSVGVGNGNRGIQHNASGTSSATWTRYTVDFIADTQTTEYEDTYILLLKVSSTAGTMLFDSVELYELLSDNAPVFMSLPDCYANHIRVKITGHNAAPKMGVLVVGECLDFPYPPDTPHEPAQIGIEATTEVSKVGNLLGSIINYKPITINALFSILSRDFVYNEFKPFWDSHASLLMPFFWGFDLTTYPESAYFVIIDPASKFSTPLSVLAYVDSLTLAMKGVS